MERENLPQQSAETGACLLERLRLLQQKHAVIGGVRGKGLFIGIGLVKDRTSREPVTSDVTYSGVSVLIRAWAPRLGRGARVYS